MKTREAYFTSDIARHIWNLKYRYRKNGTVRDQTVQDTWKRIASFLAANEKKDRDYRELQFLEALDNFKFLPGGRIQAGAGTHFNVTLLNCFVMGLMEDTLDSIFEHLKEGALTMQKGGGVGYDFSTLRPSGTRAVSSNTIATGPVSFMQIWNRMCETLLTSDARRGAMMATLRIDHPDIESFINAKQEAGSLTNFNLSVLVTDDFMDAVRTNNEWKLVFPKKQLKGSEYRNYETVSRTWSGHSDPAPCYVFETVSARKLWQSITEAAFNTAEPGVLFIDHINNWNNLWYCEHISATNPCGEIPLPPYGSCDLGSINLTAFVNNPFTPEAHMDMDAIRELVPTAVRMLDNVIDVTDFPLDIQRNEAVKKRRIGLGITGLADALIMLNLDYGTAEARNTASRIMKLITHTAYRASIELAREKGPFPLLETEKYLKSLFLHGFPADIIDGISNHGIRNSHLTAIAPTGSISILANNISSGIEPVFDFRYSRKVLKEDRTPETFDVEDFAYSLWKQVNGGDAPLPDFFTRATDLTPEQHLSMQAAVQPYIDNSISKTINIPKTFPYDDFMTIFEMAYDKGLKGCTTFRPNAVTGSVLSSEEGSRELSDHACRVDDGVCT